VTGPSTGAVAFEYAVLQAVPRVERGECANVGVVLYSQMAGYLRAAVHVDEARLLALDPAVDLQALRSSLAAVTAVCAGDAAAGPAAAVAARARFGWLTAPRSTVLRAGPVHGGVTHPPASDLDAVLERLVARLVR